MATRLTSKTVAQDEENIVTLCALYATHRRSSS
jgi:hypothetical protein